MNKLKKEFKEFLGLKCYDLEKYKYGKYDNKIWNWINQNYISKEQILKQIKELQEEPSRQGIIHIIEKL